MSFWCTQQTLLHVSKELSCQSQNTNRQPRPSRFPPYHCPFCNNCENMVVKYTLVGMLYFLKQSAAAFTRSESPLPHKKRGSFIHAQANDGFPRSAGFRVRVLPFNSISCASHLSLRRNGSIPFKSKMVRPQSSHRFHQILQHVSVWCLKQSFRASKVIC